ncbi:aminoglycoside phosphotransferase family protein [Saccharopolyspora sp. HNM0983]|uniref:Aminoglycoside phosphotransferase family protein n=1 Tax=Saccharopolyspora montiporae TaxID=2781240 RepID=A0A929BB56_9PSEU|nr:phosphotransferase [Saccharopolyspora sp. HNM0983]MBE9375601.1 aminoglycoside phosphotransferase family protein [Saccharopolyspora sp. HNM0983]
MRTPPDDLPTRAVPDGLRTFGIEPAEWDYLPVGFGDHHWSVRDAGGGGWFASVADLQHKPHCGADPRSALAGLRAAMDTAREVRDAGADFVVAPVRTQRGATAVPLGERYALSVFPDVPGETGEFGERLTDEDLQRVLKLLARLHTAAPPDSAPLSALEPDGLDRLTAVLREIGEPWQGGSYSDAAQQLVAEHAAAVGAAVRELRSRARELRSGRPAAVVTHGEPHRGNLIRTAAGFVLVDWDTVALAPPERDLAVVGGDPEVFGTYAATTGHTPDPGAIALYRLRWSLTDVVEFVDLFRAPHAATEDTAAALDGLRSTLLDLA